MKKTYQGNKTLQALKAFTISVMMGAAFSSQASPLNNLQKENNTPHGQLDSELMIERQEFNNKLQNIKNIYENTKEKSSVERLRAYHMLSALLASPHQRFSKQIISTANYDFLQVDQRSIRLIEEIFLPKVRLKALRNFLHNNLTKFLETNHTGIKAQAAHTRVWLARLIIATNIYYHNEQGILSRELALKRADLYLQEASLSLKTALIDRLELHLNHKDIFGKENLDEIIQEIDIIHPSTSKNKSSKPIKKRDLRGKVERFNCIEARKKLSELLNAHDYIMDEEENEDPMDIDVEHTSIGNDEISLDESTETPVIETALRNFSEQSDSVSGREDNKSSSVSTTPKREQNSYNTNHKNLFVSMYNEMVDYRKGTSQKYGHKHILSQIVEIYNTAHFLGDKEITERYKLSKETTQSILDLSSSSLYLPTLNLKKLIGHMDRCSSFYKDKLHKHTKANAAATKMIVILFKELLDNKKINPPKISKCIREINQGSSNAAIKEKYQGVTDRMIKKIKEEYLNQYIPLWPEPIYNYLKKINNKNNKNKGGHKQSSTVSEASNKTTNIIKANKKRKRKEPTISIDSTVQDDSRTTKRRKFLEEKKLTKAVGVQNNNKLQSRPAKQNFLSFKIPKKSAQ